MQSCQSKDENVCNCGDGCPGKGVKSVLAGNVHSWRAAQTQSRASTSDFPIPHILADL